MFANGPGLDVQKPANGTHYVKLVKNIERSNLRLFHKEPNIMNMDCIELSFIQRKWHPATKNYLKRPPTIG